MPRTTTLAEFKASSRAAPRNVRVAARALRKSLFGALFRELVEVNEHGLACGVSVQRRPLNGQTCNSW